MAELNGCSSRIFAVRRKDGGYAWVVLASSFCSYMAGIGFLFGTMGNMTVIHQTKFSITLQQSSLITSIHYGIFLMFSPVASVMVKKLSCRTTELFGGICMIAGLSLSALTKEAWHAYILYSVVTASGVSATLMASTEIITLYFERKNYLAFAIAAMGCYVGVVIWPYISQKLFDNVGYSYGMAIMSSFQLVHILAGLLYPNPTSGGNVHGDLSQNTIAIDENLACEKLTTESPSLDEKQAAGHCGQIPGPVRSQDIKQSIITLVKTFKVWVLLINCLLWSMCMSSFLTIINDFVIKTMGLTGEEAALGITFCGVANIVGSILVMATSKLKYDRATLHCGSSLLFGIMTIVMTWSTNKVWFYLITATWGLGQGILVANLLAVISDIGGPDKLALLFGIELLAEGVGGISGPPLCGYAQDQLGFTAAFYLSGSTAIAASLCILPVIIMNAKKRKQLAATNFNIAS